MLFTWINSGVGIKFSKDSKSFSDNDKPFQKLLKFIIVGNKRYGNKISKRIVR